MAAAVPPPSFLATRRGKLTLALLAAVAFLDFVDASIVNIALPSIRRDLHFSEQSLQWVPSGYLLTYGGFMLLGGRAADLIGRRRVLVAGTVVIGLASLAGGFAGSSGVLVAARLAQGLGAAMMLPAALSILTTTFREGSDRTKALSIWGAVGGLASAVGVLLGGLLTEGPGWRWVMFVNPLAALLVLAGIFALIADDRRRMQLANFDLRGALLATGGMLLLVFALVKAPDQGWGSTKTIAELAGAFALLAAFVINERRIANPLMPLSIFRVRGLAAADTTQLVAFAGLLAVFFFLTLYMQNVLGWSPIQTGASYLPLTFGVGVAAGIASQLVPRLGTRPVIVGGALIGAGPTSPTCCRG
jgi:MFS family permease